MTDSGWRKRQIALDKKAQNARELGLDYEPSKTTIDMAREAGLDIISDSSEWGPIITAEPADLERFSTLIRADEREACAKVCESRATPGTGSVAVLNGAAGAIRARGEQA
jgi:hypothetical protein